MLSSQSRGASMYDIELSENEKTIVNYISREKEISVSEASKILNVSAATVRKMFTLLEAKGFIERNHGGATLAFKPEITLRQTIHTEAKNRIAEKAASLINDNETIMMNASSTSSLIIKYLKQVQNINIITNTTLFASYAKYAPNVNIILLGGLLRGNTDAIIGTTAVQQLETYFAKYAFIGTAGFSIKNGITAHMYDEAEIPRKMVERAEKSVLLTDSSKWDKCSLIKMIELNEVDIIITDTNLREDAQREINSNGIELILV
jgi:DeoR/GlpR family transcriptional regulator of sugar metabolism